MVPAVNESDDLLVARLAAGDDDALGEIYDRYGAFVFGLALKVARSSSVAEDVVQEVFTTLWRDPKRFDPMRGSLRSFLGVLAHRRAVDAVRSESRRTAREEREGMDPSLPGYHCDEMERATLVEVIRQAIGRLPADQRRAVELAFWDGCTHRELAARLGVPEGTAKSRLRLAQAKLGKWLAPLVMETA
jgi:RNA polymerase sigma factor (sigma-70 family)